MAKKKLKEEEEKKNIIKELKEKHSLQTFLCLTTFQQVLYYYILETTQDQSYFVVDKLDLSVKILVRGGFIQHAKYEGYKRLFVCNHDCNSLIIEYVEKEKEKEYFKYHIKEIVTRKYFWSGLK